MITGTSIDVGRQVIQELGRNRDKSALLRRLIAANEQNEALRAALDGCLDAYDIHRENRNKLAHAYALPAAGDEVYRFERASGKAHPPYMASEIRLTDLEAIAAQLKKMNDQLSWAFLYKAQELDYVIFKGSARLGPPAAPPLPGKFPETDPQALEASLTKLRKRGEVDPPTE